MKNALIITGQDGVTITTNGDVAEHKAKLLSEARAISAISDEFTQGLAVETIRSLKGLLADVEECRQMVKAPVLKLGTQIDSLAKSFVADLHDEVKRLTTANDRFVSEQRRLAAAEEARRQEAARQAEQARLKAEQEARDAAEAAQRAQQTVDPFDDQSEARARAEAEKAERAQQEAARLAREAEARRVASLVPVRTVAPQGTTTKDVWRHEVIDIAALYAANPALVHMEPKTAAINEAIRKGAREIPGLRIWSEVTQQVRR